MAGHIYHGARVVCCLPIYYLVCPDLELHEAGRTPTYTNQTLGNVYTAIDALMHLFFLQWCHILGQLGLQHFFYLKKLLCLKIFKLHVTDNPVLGLHTHTSPLVLLVAAGDRYLTFNLCLPSTLPKRGRDN